MPNTCMRADTRCAEAMRGVQGGGETASKLRSQPPVVAMVIGRLRNGVRKESSWNMMFADDIVK